MCTLGFCVVFIVFFVCLDFVIHVFAFLVSVFLCGTYVFFFPIMFRVLCLYFFVFCFFCVNVFLFSRTQTLVLYDALQPLGLRRRSRSISAAFSSFFSFVFALFCILCFCALLILYFCCCVFVSIPGAIVCFVYSFFSCVSIFMFFFCVAV